MLRKTYTAIDLALNDLRTATHQTEQALADSEESRTRAEAVGTFLTGAFRRSDPKLDGSELRAANLLDHAASELAKEQGGSSAIHAALTLALSESYLGLGITDKAELLLKKAYEDMKAGNAEISPSSRKLWAGCAHGSPPFTTPGARKPKRTNGASGWRKPPSRPSRNDEAGA